MRTNQVHQFAQVPKISIPRSVLNRSHNYKTTMDAGWLVPFYVDEVLPGDTFNLKVTTFARFSTPLHPVMDNMFADVFFFFCPNRLIWNNFPKFFGEQDNPGDSTSFLVPQVSTGASGIANGSLQDYFGLPQGVPNFMYNNLHGRAYNRIWNEWFRDQNLQNSVVVDKGDGPDTASNYVLLRRGKRHDYFTSCLPWPQKGPAVSIPLGTSAPVMGLGAASGSFAAAGGTVIGVTPVNDMAAGTPIMQTATASGIQIRGQSVGPMSASNRPQVFADLSAATSATINSLRQAFQIQRVYERDARGGTRYTELIQSHFGVTSPDSRLQRTEYLGGGSTPIGINPIAQTAPTGTTGSSTPQGNLAAMGTFSHSGSGFTKSFTEHGVLIGLISIRADLTYQQGVDKMWTRQTRFDFFWPALAHIGEQAVLNQEIFAVGSANPAQDAGVFGYQERYGEYRFKISHVTGQFRSTFAQTLDSWHLAQTFATLPALNSTFIQENPPISRVVAVPTQPAFLLDCFINLSCARPIPLYGVPGNIDRF